MKLGLSPFTAVVIGTRISGKPVFILKIFPVNFKQLKRQARAGADKLGDEFPIRFNNGEIVIVYKHDALKEALGAAELLRLHLEDISGQLVEFLFASIEEIVVCNLVRSEKEKRHAYDRAN